MKIIIEDPSVSNLRDMLWSGAEDNFEEIVSAGYEDEFYAYIDEIYDDGIGLTELNDLLRFNFDQVKRDIGIFDLEEVVDIKTLKELKSDVVGASKIKDISDEESRLYDELSDKLDELSDCDDVDDFEDLKDEIENIKNEIYDVVIDGESGGKAYQKDIEKNIIDVIDSDLFYN